MFKTMLWKAICVFQSRTVRKLPERKTQFEGTKSEVALRAYTNGVVM